MSGGNDHTAAVSMLSDPRAQCIERRGVERNARLIEQPNFRSDGHETGQGEAAFLSGRQKRAGTPDKGDKSNAANPASASPPPCIAVQNAKFSCAVSAGLAAS